MYLSNMVYSDLSAYNCFGIVSRGQAYIPCIIVILFFAQAPATGI